MVPLYPSKIASIAFQNKANGSGMSIKIAKTEDDLRRGTCQLQAESTLAGNRVYWDLSRVNDENNVWVPYSYFAVPTNHPDCERRSCLAGNYRCLDEYVLPTDDYATTDCSSDAIINLHLCATPNSFMTSFSTSFPTSLTSSFSPSSPSSCTSVDN